MALGAVSHLGAVRCATLAEGRRRLGGAKRRQTAVLQQLA